MGFSWHRNVAVDFLVHGSYRWLRRSLHTPWPRFPKPGELRRRGTHGSHPPGPSPALRPPRVGRRGGGCGLPPAGQGDADGELARLFLNSPRGRLLFGAPESCEDWALLG